MSADSNRSTRARRLRSSLPWLAVGLTIFKIILERALSHYDPTAYASHQDTINNVFIISIVIIVGVLASQFEKTYERIADLLGRVERMSPLIEFAARPLQAYWKANQSRPIVESLLRRSLLEEFNITAGETEERYLRDLWEQLPHCNKYWTIQRKKPSWFSEVSTGETFLRSFREKRMPNGKLRLFVLDDKTDMAEFDSPDTMSQYWEHTGRDVETWSILKDDLQNCLRSNAPALDDRDTVVMNDEVILLYSEKKLTLTFRVVSTEEEKQENFAFAAFDALSGYRESGTGPFRRILPEEAHAPRTGGAASAPPPAAPPKQGK